MGTPYAKNSDTSKEAAEFVSGKTRLAAQQIWQYIASRPEGATGDEVAFDLGIPMQSVTARMWALKYSKLIVQPPNKPKRLTRRACRATVWVVTELDFDAHYKEPPKNKKAISDFLDAGRHYVENSKDEEALDLLIEAAWAAFSDSPRPVNKSHQEESDFGFDETF